MALTGGQDMTDSYVMEWSGVMARYFCQIRAFAIYQSTTYYQCKYKYFILINKQFLFI